MMEWTCQMYEQTQSSYSFIYNLFIYRIWSTLCLLFTGFEYCVESTIGGFGPVEKTYHLSRRRRWIRQRTMVADSKAIKAKVLIPRSNSSLLIPHPLPFPVTKYPFQCELVLHFSHVMVAITTSSLLLGCIPASALYSFHMFLMRFISIFAPFSCR